MYSSFEPNSTPLSDVQLSKALLPIFVTFVSVKAPLKDEQSLKAFDSISVMAAWMFTSRRALHPLKVSLSIIVILSGLTRNIICFAILQEFSLKDPRL